mgnify:CR=1 FL=1
MATTISSGRASSPKLTANIADHGTIYGGRGLIFDGVTDYLYNDSFTAHQTTTGTLSAWAKLGDISGYQYIVSVGGTTTTGATRSIAFENGSVFFAGYGANWVSSATVTADVWNHYAITWNGTSVVLYLNGIAYTQTVGGLVTPTGTKISIGGSAWDYGSLINATISDVKVFDATLTEAQIQELYLKPEQSAPSAVQANLKQWFPMCAGNPDSPQSIVYDHSEKGLGANLVANGSDWTDSNGDGLADDWGGANNPSIVTGNGFTGNAQRDEGSGGSGATLQLYNTGIMEAGKTYFISLKYRASNEWIFYTNGGGTVVQSNISANTGNAIEYTKYVVGQGNGEVRFVIASGAGKYLEIDDVSVKEIKMGNHATTNFFGSMADLINESNDSEIWDATNNRFSFTTSGWTGYDDTTSLVDDTDWVKTTNIDRAKRKSDADQLYLRKGSGTYEFVSHPLTLESGKTYNVSGAYHSDSSSTVNVEVGASAPSSASDYTNWATQSLTASGGTVNLDFVAQATTGHLVIELSGGNNEPAYFDHIAVREVGISSSGFATADLEPTIPQVPLLRYNEKMVFDGVDDECSMGLGAGAFGTGDQTLSAWFNASDLTGNQVIFGAGHYSAITSFGGPALMLGSAVLHGVAGEGASTVYDNLTSGTLSVGKTYHGVFVRDATNDYYYLYVNGVLVDSYSSSINPRYDNTYDFWMMGRSGNASEKGNYFQGVVDDCSVFNTAFSATEVQELFNDGVALDATTHSKADYLMGYWRNDGISSWVDRRGWSYLDFDGSGDRTENTSFTTHQSDTGTISGWFKFDDVSTQQRFFGVGGSTTYGATRSIEVDGGNIWSINYGSAGVQDWNSTASVVVGRWYHLAVTWNGTSIVVYVDGTAYSQTLSGIVTPTGTKVQVGGAVWDGQYELNGQVKSASFYTAVLSASEIQSIYNNGINSSEIGNSNLAHYWVMDNASTVKDLVGSNDLTVTNATLNSGNNGTVAGTPDSITIREGLTSGKDGLGFPFKTDNRDIIRLNGVDEYVDIPMGGGFGFSGDDSFSIEAWIKPDQVTAQIIVAFGSDTSSSPEGKRVAMYITNAGKLTLAFWGNDVYKNTTLLAVDTWYHLVVTYAGGNRTSANCGLYIDGTALSSLTGGTASALDLSDMDFCRIGADMTPAQYFKGAVDEVKIYNKALSATEVSKNYKHGKGKHKN